MFKSVQVAAVVLFCALNLDAYIAIRCAPHHSYTNPAERCMSILNLALQGGATARAPMPDVQESLIRNCSSITDIRAKAERSEDLKKELQKSVNVVRDQVITQFNRIR